jgi:outer membrane protein OmpA-like peptidoglycan-associated protein
VKKSLASLVLLSAAVLVLPGCATKKYVNEQDASMSLRMDQKIGAVESRVNELDSRLGGRIESVSKTAQEALERANAAGKLAEGKFVYESVLKEGVAFKFGSSNLTTAAKSQLSGFAQKLKDENKNIYLEIQGHTDNVGSPDLNLKLGETRAQAVYQYLATTAGLPLHRMNVISYGETAPLESNRTAAGRAENRRVVIVVLQ